MMHYLEIDFWDNVVDGVYSKNHKFLTMDYVSYCNILSSSDIRLSSKSHGVYELFKNIIYLSRIIILKITILN